MSIPAALVVAHARKYIGVCESPPGSNSTPFGRAYGLDRVWWCGIFTWYAYREAGLDLRRVGFHNPAGTNALHVDADRLGWRRVSPVHIEPGDMVIWGFGVTGPGDLPDDADHVGIASRHATRAGVWDVEGNTSAGRAGSQANGGGVFERRRPISQVFSAWRPPQLGPMVLERKLHLARRAMRGDDVFALQGLVRMSGPEVDGHYGPRTDAALRRWQRGHGLKPNGVFDETNALVAGWKWAA